MDHVEDVHQLIICHLAAGPGLHQHTIKQDRIKCDSPNCITLLKAVGALLYNGHVCCVRRSGSGKTCNLKRALGYLVETTVDPQQALPPNFTSKFHGM